MKHTSKFDSYKKKKRKQKIYWLASLPKNVLPDQCQLQVIVQLSNLITNIWHSNQVHRCKTLCLHQREISVPDIFQNALFYFEFLFSVAPHLLGTHGRFGSSDMNENPTWFPDNQYAVRWNTFRYIDFNAPFMFHFCFVFVLLTMYIDYEYCSRNSIHQVQLYIKICSIFFHKLIDVCMHANSSHLIYKIVFEIKKK